jgi:hypothetical protein
MNQYPARIFTTHKEEYQAPNGRVSWVLYWESPFLIAMADWRFFIGKESIKGEE